MIGYMKHKDMAGLHDFGQTSLPKALTKLSTGVILNVLLRKENYD